MKTMSRRVVVALASGLLAVGGLAGTANAQTDPGPDPNEGGVTETADLDEGTEVPDPDDAVDSPDEAAENAEGEGEEVVGGEDAEPADGTETPEFSAPEDVDLESGEVDDPAVADDPDAVQFAADEATDDDEDVDDEDSQDAAEESAVAGSSSISDAPIAGQPTFTG